MSPLGAPGSVSFSQTICFGVNTMGLVSAYAMAGAITTVSSIVITFASVFIALSRLTNDQRRNGCSTAPRPMVSSDAGGLTNQGNRRPPRAQPRRWASVLTERLGVTAMQD